MLIHRVKRTIDHYHLLNQGDRLVVGVSAGVDSMVLLHLLNAYRQTFNLSLIEGDAMAFVRVSGDLNVRFTSVYKPAYVRRNGEVGTGSGS